MGLARRWRESSVVIEMGRARWLAMMTMAAGVCAPCQADFPPSPKWPTESRTRRLPRCLCTALPSTIATSSPSFRNLNSGIAYHVIGWSTHPRPLNRHVHIALGHGCAAEVTRCPSLHGQLLAYAITDMNETNSYRRKPPCCAPVTPQSLLNAIQPIISHPRSPPTPYNNRHNLYTCGRMRKQRICMSLQQEHYLVIGRLLPSAITILSPQPSPRPTPHRGDNATAPSNGGSTMHVQFYWRISLTTRRASLDVINRRCRSTTQQPRETAIVQSTRTYDGAKMVPFLFRAYDSLTHSPPLLRAGSELLPLVNPAPYGPRSVPHWST